MTETCTNHEWTEDLENPGRWVCPECTQETTSCTQCARPLDTSLLVCTACLNRARKIITDIIHWMTEHTFGVTIVTLRAIRYDRDRITTSDDDARLPFGLDAIVDDPEDTRISAVKHPDDAIAYLNQWAHAWADTRGDQPSANPLTYLVDHTLWAIQNPGASAWDDYHTEARQVRATVRRLLGIAPVTEPVPCVHCGGRIERAWTDDGLDDIRRCTGCGMEWPTEARLLHTYSLVLHQLPTTHPDTLVTTEQARRVYPQIHPATLRKWVQRGHITPQGQDVRGTPLYRLGDITERVNPTRQATA